MRISGVSRIHAFRNGKVSTAALRKKREEKPEVKEPAARQNGFNKNISAMKIIGQKPVLATHCNCALSSIVFPHFPLKHVRIQISSECELLMQNILDLRIKAFPAPVGVRHHRMIHHENNTLETHEGPKTDQEWNYGPE